MLLFLWCAALLNVFTDLSTCEDDYESKLEKTSKLVSGLGELLVNESKELPKTGDIIDKINKQNAMYEEQLARDMSKENAEYDKKRNSTTLCNGENYPRDYEHICPENWKLLESGECWGAAYKGPCESMMKISDLKKKDKIELETRCCLSWPRLYNAQDETIKASRYRKLTIRGPVNSTGAVLAVN